MGYENYVATAQSIENRIPARAAKEVKRKRGIKENVEENQVLE